jgi:hypothetical protein
MSDARSTEVPVQNEIMYQSTIKTPMAPVPMKIRR